MAIEISGVVGVIDTEEDVIVTGDVKAYECKKCGQLHKSQGKLFVIVHGDIELGDSGLYLIDEKFPVVFCNSCFRAIVNKATEPPLVYRGL